MQLEGNAPIVFQKQELSNFQLKVVSHNLVLLEMDSIVRKCCQYLITVYVKWNKPFSIFSHFIVWERKGTEQFLEFRFSVFISGGCYLVLAFRGQFTDCCSCIATINL